MKQDQLAQITVVGTAETEMQLQIRNTIMRQQKLLLQIHESLFEVGKFNLNTVELHKMIDKFFSNRDIQSYGFTTLLEEYKFEKANIYPSERTVIVFSYPMNYEEMQSAPSIESGTEIMYAYSKVGEIVLELTKLLRDIGVHATGHHPLGDVNQYHHLLMPPHAVKAGMGEKGRTGLFIDFKLGPMVRLGMISVDIELTPSVQTKKGIEEFCKRCLYCVSRCPPKAIQSTTYVEHLKLGTKFDFKINGDRCIKYFERNYGCGRCVVHCVLAKKTPDEIKLRMDRIQRWYGNWIENGEMNKLQEQIDNLSIKNQ